MAAKVLGAAGKTIESSSVLRYAVTGVVATVVHYGLYYILLWSGVMMELSYAGGWIVSLGLNFWMSGRFTFRTSLSAGKGVLFLAAHLVNFVLHMLLLEFWVRIMGVNEYVAPFLVFAIAVPINYLLVRYAMTGRRFGKRGEAGQKSASFKK